MSIRAIAYRTSALALAAGAFSISLGGAALADADNVVSQVTVTAQSGGAAAQAPSQAPVDAVQPTSVVTRNFIANDVAATANYDDAIRITPSVSSVGPNGPGLMENQFLTIRGFQDGQYNLTIDGVAWGDSNDFTHHSTSYVMGHDLGQVSVDRGPGTASTLGDATFGGTIALTTKSPLDHAGLEGYGSIGSFNTYLGGIELDSGKLDNFGGAKGLLDVEHVESDGALSYMGQSRTNLFSKVEVPLSANTTLTFAAMYNQIQQYVGLGATDAQYQAHGYNYGLNNDPTSQAYYRYNRDEITTNLEYIGLTSNLGGGWTLDNKLYSYDYYHLGHNGMDPNGETPNGTYYGANNVSGQVLHNNYISYGDVFRISKDFGIAVVKSGFWYDFQHNNRTLVDVDFTKNIGGVLDPSQPGGGNPPTVGQISPNLVPGVERHQLNTLTTFQPYLEADIKPIAGLTITPGVKFDYFRRTTNAPVQQGTYAPFDYSKTWTKALPSLAAHYTVSPSIVVYAQVAQGFLAPNLNTFYTTNPSQSTLQPQTTWNYQTGATYHSGRLLVSGDFYYIDFGNMIQKRNNGAYTIFYNQGGVIYQGVEAEATYRLIGGLSLYANGSVNSAKDKTYHYTIAAAPESTAAGGFLYDQGPLHASLLAKYTGKSYGDNNGTQAIEPINAYTITDLSLGYTFPKSGHRPAIKLSGMIGNLFDTRGHQALAGYTGFDGNPLWWNIVPRNAELKISVAY